VIRIEERSTTTLELEAFQTPCEALRKTLEGRGLS
jgi:hypothetical protein